MHNRTKCKQIHRQHTRTIPSQQVTLEDMTVPYTQMKPQLQLETIN